GPPESVQNSADRHSVHMCGGLRRSEGPPVPVRTCAHSPSRQNEHFGGLSPLGSDTGSDFRTWYALVEVVRLGRWWCYTSSLSSSTRPANAVSGAQKLSRPVAVPRCPSVR